MHNLPQNITKVFPNHTLAKVLENVQSKITKNVVWRRLRCRFASKTNESSGLCLNTLTFSPQLFYPCLLQFHQAGRKRLLQDEALQEAIAHAYWQTCWAGGSVRQNAGLTEPVAFVAIDRSQSFQTGRDHCYIKQISKGHYILGKENVLLYSIAEIDAQDIFWENEKFDGRADNSVLEWLNENTFFDRYVGGNKEKNGRVSIHRFVPVSGSHVISNLLPHELEHFWPADMELDLSQVIAATNSGFFLNFPEEYANKLCAMNDPAGLLITDGKLWQLPLTRRGAILVDKHGRAAIRIVSMTDFTIKLPWENVRRRFDSTRAFHIDDVNQTGKNMVIYTPAFKAGCPPVKQVTPEGEVVDFAVVFGKIAAAKLGGGLAIPPNGLVISRPAHSLPENRLPELIRQNGSRVQFEFLHEKFGLAEIKTAQGAGPVLLDDGIELSDNYFAPRHGVEQFLAAKTEDHQSVQAGIVPTRFPHDVNQTRAPRTILGLTKRNRLILVVIDGRNVEHSLGVTLKESAGIAKALGCTQALNLDGGGSSVMYINQDEAASPPLKSEIPKGIVNIPSDSGYQDRLIPAPLLMAK
ncbi:MAG: phosphodiester glycosidase family protein [bacterium]